MKPTTTHILILSDAYIAHQKIAQKTLSSRLFKDVNKLPALYSGADITVSRFNDTMEWFAKNWPEGLAWPVVVPRPDVDSSDTALVRQADAA